MTSALASTHLPHTHPEELIQIFSGTLSPPQAPTFVLASSFFHSALFSLCAWAQLLTAGELITTSEIIIFLSPLQKQIPTSAAAALIAASSAQT